jgi:hypothetical protein
VDPSRKMARTGFTKLGARNSRTMTRSGGIDIQDMYWVEISRETYKRPMRASFGRSVAAVGVMGVLFIAIASR